MFILTKYNLLNWVSHLEKLYDWYGSIPFIGMAVFYVSHSIAGRPAFILSWKHLNMVLVGVIVMLLCFTCEEALWFRHFGVNLCNLRSFFYKWTVYPCSDAYWPISALSVTEKTVYSFRFLVLVWSLCFSNTRFKLLLASRIATSSIPVPLWLGSPVAGLKYCRIPVYSYRSKTVSEAQWSLFRHLHC